MRIETLTDAGRDEIHDGALRLLEEVGLKVPPAPRLRERLIDGGLPPDGEHLRIPRAAVAKALKTAPRRIQLSARSAERNITLDGARTFVTTDGCGASTLDIDSGERRRSVLADVAASARLADALGGFDVYWTMVSAHDVPPPVRVAREFLAALQNTTKHVQVIDVARREEAVSLVAMARAITDSGAAGEAPVSMLISVVSPLRLDPAGTEAALTFAGAGLPVVACSMPIAGVTAPATAPGAVLLAHAEILGFVTILQTLHPGAPVIYCSFPAFAHARTGVTNYDDPRYVWAAGAAARMGRSMNLPCFTSNELTALWSGTDLITGGGLLEISTLLSYEQLVIDNERIADLSRAAADQPLNADTLALDIIRDVGPGGHFLAQVHTARHVREFSIPRFGGREASAEDRREPGAPPDARERARREARRLLESHAVPPLPDQLETALERIAETPARTASA